MKIVISLEDEGHVFGSASTALDKFSELKPSTQATTLYSMVVELMKALLAASEEAEGESPAPVVTNVSLEVN